MYLQSLALATALSEGLSFALITVLLAASATLFILDIFHAWRHENPRVQLWVIVNRLQLVLLNITVISSAIYQLAHEVLLRPLYGVAGNMLFPLFAGPVVLSALVAVCAEFAYLYLLRKTNRFAGLVLSAGSVAAAWILFHSYIVRNFWMVRPVYYEIINGSLQPTGRLFDLWGSAGLVDFAVALIDLSILGSGVSIWVGWRLITQDRSRNVGKRLFWIGLLGVWLLAPLQLVLGGIRSTHRYEYAPAAGFAGVNGQMITQKAAPYYVFGIPDTETKTMEFGVALPQLLSFMVTGDWEGEVEGLDAFPKEDWPDVMVVFLATRVLLFVPLSLMGLSAFGLILRGRGELCTNRMFGRLGGFVWAGAGLVILARWIGDRAGIYPFAIYGLLRLEDSYLEGGGSGMLLAWVAILLVQVALAVGAVCWFARAVAAAIADCALRSGSRRP